MKNLEQPLLGRTVGASLKLMSKVNNIESAKNPVQLDKSDGFKISNLETRA